MQPYVASLAEMVGKANDEKDLQRILDQWGDEHADDSALSDIVIMPQLMADLGGQLMVDVHESRKVQLSRIASSNNHNQEGNDQKRWFYSQLLERARIGDGISVLEMFAGEGHSNVALMDGVNHIAIEKDDIKARSYALKHPNATLYITNNEKLKDVSFDGLDISVCDCDAYARPFEAFEALLGKYRPRKSMLTFLTWGFRGYCGEVDYVLDRNAAWEIMRRSIKEECKKRGLKSRPIGYSSAKNEDKSINQSTQKQLIYGAFIIGDEIDSISLDYHDPSIPFAMSRRIALANDPIPAFLDLQWTEAIEAYKGMDIPRAKEFAGIIEEYSKRSAKVRKLMIDAIKNRSYDLLIKSLEEGTTFREYSGDLQQFASGLGVSVDNPAYLQNVFRTNLQTAYSAGRWRAMSDPDVVGAKPYWQYVSTMDAGTCDFCRSMHMQIFEIGNPATAHLVPPCHHQSRSAAVSHRLVKGERVNSKPPAGYQRRAGWNPDFAANPTELLRI